jgi:serine/threonine protein kinase
MEPREENRLSMGPVVPEEPRARYEILRVVNRGGMGEIALGRVRGTKGFEKLVVLKRLRADAERDDHLAMFDVEQELMSRIEHPNIVKVFDQPVIENTPYLAMEYVRGRNLDQVIRQAKDAGDSLSMQFAFTAISEVLRGLAFVHRLKDSDGKALGVVHQDITPSNIMVSFFGEVKITDFGISYVTSRDGGLRRGVLKGKPRYVAPEVLAGKRVNNRADIYGVGVVLFELLTQQALFARASVKETLSAVARGELPDFKSMIPNLTDGIKKIFEKSLAKDPADRYRTAEEMGADIVGELAKMGGAMSPGRLGYVVRQFFRDDPDVPEVDASFEAALSAESHPGLPSSFRAPDLVQTLSELDRLLPRSSTDLFTLPPELKGELSGIQDMDPFMAATPIPDFVWDAPDDAEILRRADEKFGTLSPPTSIKEPPPLRGPDHDPAADSWSPATKKGLELPPFESPKRSLAAPAIPSFPSSSRENPLLEAKRSSSSSSSSSESSPPPFQYTEPPRVSGRRASSGLREPPPVMPVVPVVPVATAAALDAFVEPPMRPVVATAETPVEASSDGMSMAHLRTDSPVEPIATVVQAPIFAPSIPRVTTPLSFRPVEPPAQLDHKKNFSFWMGMIIGMSLGLAGGAALFSMFAR